LRAILGKEGTHVHNFIYLQRKDIKMARKEVAIKFLNNIGIYIHLPFCYKKCWYCDFYSIVYNEKIMQTYIEAVCKELMFYKNCKKQVRSIYFGGGTPSLLEPKAISKIITKIKQTFDVSPNAEVTIETNPELLTENLAYNLRIRGINRISIGAQSFSERDLQFLKREHSPQQTQKAIKIAKKQGFSNISVDFILGLPLQTSKQFDDAATCAKEAGVSHISGYILKLESNCCRHIELLSEGETCDIYESFAAAMNAHYFKQYEISNFSIENKACIHNLGYWQCEEYIGIGPAAHSYFNGTRYHVIADINAYILNLRSANHRSTLPPHLQKTTSNLSPSPSLYVVDDCNYFEEYVMLGLRLNSGININKLLAIDLNRGTKLLANLKKKKELMKVIVINNDRLFLTLKGFLVSNYVITSLLY
jgi:oxygen-independent coproporphyrinogen-3 oxidase